MRILIIEDETKTSDYLRKGLSEAGFVVDTTPKGDGEYTIEAWQEKLGTQTAKVTVGVSDIKTVDFRFKGQ